MLGEILTDLHEIASSDGPAPALVGAVLADVRRLVLPHHEDARGAISWLNLPGLPFTPVRAYWLTDWHALDRGVHAHRHLHQLYVAVHGAVTVHLDDATQSGVERLDNPHDALLLPPMTWRRLTDPTPGTVLLAFASGLHDETEILRDHALFLAEARR